jgi:hypothetical protein
LALLVLRSHRLFRTRSFRHPDRVLPPRHWTVVGRARSAHVEISRSTCSLASDS